VIGVVQNGKYNYLAEDPQPYFFLPLTQHFVSMRVLQIRTSIAPQALMLPVEHEIKGLDPGLPIFSLRTMADSLAGANGFMLFRLGALLTSCIGSMGLTMALIGVYGVVAFSATQRTREIGIRIALGASRRQVLNLVLGQGLWVISVGASGGLLAAFLISRALSDLLIQVSATDPFTLLAATLFLGVIALYASYVPARRAMKLNPMVALRYE
jgi:ABC-type antimicrobial peptide transport system permease subunit